MSSAVHWNSHKLCAIDVETTGTDAKKHEIIQICILPLNGDITPDINFNPFYTDMVPEKKQEDWEPKALRTHGIDMVKLIHTGLDRGMVADRLEEWFERLNLPFGKKIIPLAHNWPFEQAMLTDWLGSLTMDHLFWQFRDTMAFANSMNDMADFHNQPWPYPKTGLKYLCSQMKVDNPNAHDALGDCIATAECYRKMMLRHHYI